MMMSPFKIILKPNLQYIPDFENPKNQKGHVISDSFLRDPLNSII